MAKFLTIGAFVGLCATFLTGYMGCTSAVHMACGWGSTIALGAGLALTYIKPKKAA